MGLNETVRLNEIRKLEESNHALLAQLVAEQQRTNQLLEWIGGLLTPDPQRAGGR